MDAKKSGGVDGSDTAVLAAQQPRAAGQVSGTSSTRMDIRQPVTVF